MENLVWLYRYYRLPVFLMGECCDSRFLVFSPYFQLGVSGIVVAGMSFVLRPCAPTFGLLDTRTSAVPVHDLS